MKLGGNPSGGIPPSSRFLLGWALLFCLHSSPGAPAQVGLEEADRIAREIHARGRYPSSLDLGGRKEPSLWKRIAGKLPRERKEEGPRRPPPRPGSFVLRFGETLWGAILAALLAGILAVALVGAHLLDQGGGSGKAGRKSVPGRGKGKEGDAGGGRGPSPPADPEELARRGRFDLALRALLLLALREAGWSPQGPARSLTAREVLAGLAAEDPRRIPLGRILAAEEAVRFAGRPATEELFREALEAYRALARRREGSGEEGGPPW